MENGVSSESVGRSGHGAWWGGLWRYAVAMGTVGLAAALRWELSGLLGNGVLFITFYPAVAVTGMLAGVRAGLVATVLSALAVDWWFQEPRYSLKVDNLADMVSLGLFTASGVLISIMGGMVQRAREREGRLSERERAAEEIRRSEAVARERAGELAAMMDAMPMITLIAHDRQGRRMSGNRAGYELLRVPRSANLAKSAPPGECPETYRVFQGGRELPPEKLPVRQAAATGREVRDFEARLVFADGTWRDLYGNAVPLWDERGQPRGAVGAFLDVTDRKGAEAARAMLAAIVESSQDAIIGMDLAGTITSWNARAERLFGYRREEILGQPTTRIIPPERQAEETTILERLRRGELLDHFESVSLAKDGRRIPVSLTISPVRDPAGAVSGASKILRDITERCRLEQAVHESERKFKALFDNAKDAILIYDMAGHFADANREACERLGYRREELLRMGPRDIDSPESAAQVSARLEELLHQGHALFETEQQRRDGTRLLVELNSSLVELGEAKLVFSTCRDITARKATEEALRRAEARLAQAVRVAGFGIFEHDHRSGRIEYSPLMREVMGFGAEEAVTLEAILQRVVGEDRQAMAEEVRRAHDPAGDGRFEVEFRVARSDGRIGWVNARSQTLFEGEGSQRRPVRTIGAALDVTARKEAQAELERLVAERTAKLQEMVDELEHFSYSITHDLRAPLRAMKGFAEIASRACRECGRREAVECLGKLSAAAERMDCLITDALAYSRSVRQELPLEEVDTEELLRGMLETYPELQAVKGQIRVEGRLPWVRANRAGLTQCFSNLLGNAVRFIQPGRAPEIQVWAETVPRSASSGPGQAEPGEWVRLWVADQGIGIAKELLPRVFDMFARGASPEAGTGIGLALVRKVAERMDGRVGAESEEGKGSRFWLEVHGAEGQRVAARRAESRELEESHGPGATVLYVEDEESDVFFMRKAFEAAGQGATLRVVTNGRAALEYLSGTGVYGDRGGYPVPAGVLLDLNLPEVHGFEVLRWLRQQPPYAALPVVIFSSSTKEEDRVKAEELGANDFVVKPSSGLEFREVVGRLRERMKGSGAAAGAARAQA